MRGSDSQTFLINLEQSENDFAEISVNLNNEHTLQAQSVLDWSAELSQSLLDYDSYERNLSGTIGVSHFWNALWVHEARLFGGATDSEFDDYDGNSLRLRLRAYRYLQNSSILQRIRMSANLEEKNRDAAWVSYRSTSLGIEGRFRLGMDVTLDLGLAWESRDYDGESPYTGQVREDDRIELSAYALSPLREGQYLTSQALYTSRDSSDTYFETDGFQLLIGLLWVK